MRRVPRMPHEGHGHTEAAVTQRPRSHKRLGSHVDRAHAMAEGRHRSAADSVLRRPLRRRMLHAAGVAQSLKAPLAALQGAQPAGPTPTHPRLLRTAPPLGCSTCPTGAAEPTCVHPPPHLPRPPAEPTCLPPPHLLTLQPPDAQLARVR
eukprot:337590-Chlamydomonas_euryale.AAC.3